MSKLASISRRSLLMGSAAVAGGVVFGYWQYQQPYSNPLLSDLSENEAVLTPYVRIDERGVTVITPRAEMGQGVHTTLAALVAEELDLSLEDVTVEHGPASKAYYNGTFMEEGLPFASTNQSVLAKSARSLTRVPAKFMALQLTGGSSSVPDGFTKMRKAGAAAREVLLEAASHKLGVSKSTLSTERGIVFADDGRALTYVELAPLASSIAPPSNPKLKLEADWKLLGKSQKRVDMVPKCTGRAEFSIDVQPEGLLYATVKMNPHLGAGINSYDASDAERMRGVKKVIPLDNGVAVIASNSWYAFRAAEAISFDWQKANYPDSTEELFVDIAKSFGDQHNSQFRNDGNAKKVIALAQRDLEDTGAAIIDGEYRVPFLAHAAMEPMNATAYFREGKLDVWAGNQMPTQVLIEGEAITGLDQDNIRVHTTYMGGSFGRRAEMDFIKQAISIAKVMEGTPIKLTWSREEDTTHDNYRPMAMARFKAAIAADGAPAIDIHMAAASCAASQFGRYGIKMAGPDTSVVQAGWDQPYDFSDYCVSGYLAKETLPISSWRSVGASQNGFFHESIIDEVAHASGEDPMLFRLAHVKHSGSLEVLEELRRISNWDLPLPEGWARGVAFCLSFGVPAAQVVEISMQAGRVKLERVYAVVDVGKALDPSNLEAQVFSGINTGLSAAIMGEITIKDGKVEQSNFHDYGSLRMYQAPDYHVRVLENGPMIRGIGEPGTPPAAPALANAIFVATGKRIRELPLSKHIEFI